MKKLKERAKLWILEDLQLVIAKIQRHLKKYYLID